MNLRIVISRESEIREAAFSVRKAVFIDEQGFRDKLDDIDETAFHIVAFDGEKAVGCGRFFSENGDSIYHVGRVAVLSEYRGRNVGRVIMNGIEEYLRNSVSVSAIELSAQKRAKDFYIKLGYEALGDEYLEENYPHIFMRKKLN